MLYTNGKVCCCFKAENANTSCTICALVEMDYSYSHAKEFITWWYWILHFLSLNGAMLLSLLEESYAGRPGMCLSRTSFWRYQFYYGWRRCDSMVSCFRLHPWAGKLDVRVPHLLFYSCTYISHHKPSLVPVFSNSSLSAKMLGELSTSFLFGVDSLASWSVLMSVVPE